MAKKQKDKVVPQDKPKEESVETQSEPVENAEHKTSAKKSGQKTVMITDGAMLAKLQDEGKLIGWDPDKKEAVIKED